jgi:hypothetical protein
MAITTSVYGLFAKGQINGAHPVDLDTDTLKVALLTSTYAPNLDTDEFYSNLTNELANGSGYVTGGLALTTKVVGYDTGGNFAYLDADDSTWTFVGTKTFRYAVLYKDTGTGSTSPLVLLIDFGANEAPTDVDFVLQWAAVASGGVLKVVAA